MKKKAAILMCAIALAMTACGSKDAQEAAGEVSSVADEESVATDEVSSASESKDTTESSAEAENSVTEESAEASTETEAFDEEKVEYAPGVFTETGYDAEWLGYRFTTPEGYVMATQEQLLSLMGLSMDTVSEDLSDAMIEYAKQTIVYDLYAANETTGSNVNVCVQNTPTSFFTLEQLVDASLEQVENMQSINVTVHEGREMVEIAGREFMKVEMDSEYEGYTMKQNIYTTMLPDYVITLNISYFEGNEADAEALLAAFTEL